MESPKKSIGRVGLEDVDDFNDFEGFFEGAYRRNWNVAFGWDFVNGNKYFSQTPENRLQCRFLFQNTYKPHFLTQWWLFWIQASLFIIIFGKAIGRHSKKHGHIRGRRPRGRRWRNRWRPLFRQGSPVCAMGLFWRWLCVPNASIYLALPQPLSPSFAGTVFFLRVSWNEI